MSHFILFFISLLSTPLAGAPPQFTGRQSFDAIWSLPLDRNPLSRPTR